MQRLNIQRMVKDGTHKKPDPKTSDPKLRIHFKNEFVIQIPDPLQPSKSLLLLKATSFARLRTTRMWSLGSDLGALSVSRGRHRQDKNSPSHCPSGRRQ